LDENGLLVTYFWNKQQMKTIERIFQAVLFEIIALFFIITGTVLIAGIDAEKMTVVGVGLSVFAMIWNYIYNLVFDKLAGYNRIERGVLLRALHACGFELGMIAITLPVVTWYLGITWVSAIILEAGVLAFILVYTFAFNWWYDRYQPYQKMFAKQSINT